MPQLILIRHAKSDWADPGLGDHDRPLNARGRADAPHMGAWIKAQVTPDMALCSTSARTRETWSLMQIDSPTEFTRQLYLPAPETIAQLLRQQTAETIAVISHNMACADFADWLAATPPDHPRFEDYPTSATAIFQVPAWSKLTSGCGQVQAFATPHDLSA